MLSLTFVDDDEAIRDLALLSLELDKSIDLRTAASGPEGLDRCHNRPPDGILLDVMMPDMDGPGVLRTLREAGISPISP